MTSQNQTGFHRSNQDNRYCGISQVVVPDFLADAIVSQVVWDISRIHRSICEYGITLTPLYRFIFVVLIS